MTTVRPSYESLGKSKVVIEELPIQVSPEMKRSRKPVKSFVSSSCKKQLLLKYIDTRVGPGIEVGEQPNKQGNLGETRVGVQSTKEGDIPNVVDETGVGLQGNFGETRVGVQGNFGETGVGVQAAEDSHIPNVVDETGVGDIPKVELIVMSY
ncbi:hypothetical protein L6452_43285 [Arctium lappa]|uniref:Uncharacterized protein n=1 Tax=Arctium lappa TaxID=4217 RepID=A0ACB8XLE3_ARCLA|nr:hypothetical protein L6452_43285 [Arctium lappa]